MAPESFSHSAELTWQTVDRVEFLRSQRSGPARWNVTPCNAVVVQFPGEPRAYRLELRELVTAFVNARTAPHDPPRPSPPQPRRPCTSRALSLLLLVLSGLLTGCLSASFLMGVWSGSTQPKAPHVHQCQPVLGYPVRLCTDCGEACLSLAPLSPFEVV